MLLIIPTTFLCSLVTILGLIELKVRIRKQMLLFPSSNWWFNWLYIKCCLWRIVRNGSKYWLYKHLLNIQLFLLKKSNSNQFGLPGHAFSERTINIVQFQTQKKNLRKNLEKKKIEKNETLDQRSATERNPTTNHCLLGKLSVVLASISLINVCIREFQLLKVREMSWRKCDYNFLFSLYSTTSNFKIYFTVPYISRNIWRCLGIYLIVSRAPFTFVTTFLMEVLHGK